MTGGGDWLLLQELLERGDPEFVDRLRGFHDADALGRFAERWIVHPSPNARRLLLAYLERPLNAYRHEALIKRLFKLAESNADDAVMARFLVAFDRSIRREQRTRMRWEFRRVGSRAEAQALETQWRSEGYLWIGSYESPGRDGPTFAVSGRWTESYVMTPPGTSMPRGEVVDHVIGWDYLKMKPLRARLPDWVVRVGLDPREHDEASRPNAAEARMLERRFRLFSLPTRQYLRRRAWRYFRRLGKEHPERYVAAISEALALYEDADVNSGLALIDNWGLTHALFHHSPVLMSRPRYWTIAEGRSLAELEPSPIYEKLWRSSPRASFDLMARARCRPVRQWAIRMLRRDPAAIRAVVEVEDALGLLGHKDPDVVAFAVEWLRGADDLSSVPPDRWLAIAETARPEALETLAEIMGRQIAPDRIALDVAARLASARPLPMARLGLSWLRGKQPASEEERRGLLALLEAACEPVRPGIIAWLRAVLSSEFRTDELLEFLDSRHADARAEGLAWFRSEPRARDDVTLWQRLLESPYDDVRLALSGDLEARLKARDGGVFDIATALDPERLRLLWASVLLNVNRGSRIKPGVIEQVSRRLGRRPEEAASLLPMLAIGLRSLRAPERRAALDAVVGLVERRPEAASMVREALPELQWT